MYLGIVNHNMKEFNVKGELVNTEYVSEYLLFENNTKEVAKKNTAPISKIIIKIFT